MRCLGCVLVCGLSWWAGLLFGRGVVLGWWVAECYLLVGWLYCGWLIVLSSLFYFLFS